MPLDTICDSFAKFYDNVVIPALCTWHCDHIIWRFHECGVGLDRIWSVTRLIVVQWKFQSIFRCRCLHPTLLHSCLGLTLSLIILIHNAHSRRLLSTDDAKCGYKGFATGTARHATVSFMTIAANASHGSLSTILDTCTSLIKISVTSSFVLQSFQSVYYYFYDLLVRLY